MTVTITVTRSVDLPMWDWMAEFSDGRAGAWSAVTRVDAVRAACAWAASKS